MHSATALTLLLLIIHPPATGHAQHDLCIVNPLQQRSFLESVCPHLACWGTVADGLQLWQWPFKLAEGIRLNVSAPEGAATRPESAIVHTSPWDQAVSFRHGDASTTQVRIWPSCRPCAVVLEASGPGTLTLSLRAVLAPMHLSVPGPNSLKLSSHRSRWTARGPHDTVLTVHLLQGTGRARWSESTFELQFRAPSPDQPAIVLLGGTGLEGLNLDQLHDVRQRHRQRVDKLLARLPEVRVPAAPWVRKAMVWSGLSLHRLLVHNPDLGWGLISGYGPCHDQPTRPRYAWFFDEPTLAAAAYLMLGLDDPVRRAFRFLRRYQRDDGKPVHEVTQSLRYWPKYFEEFRYAYMHADSGPFYLVGHWLYARATGDRDFLTEQWPSLVAAFRWCERQVNRDTGLFEIRPGQWGASEATIDVRYDSGTNGMWLVALQATAELARWVQQPQLARVATEWHDRLRPKIHAAFIRPRDAVIRWAVRRDGSIVERPIPQVFVSGWLGGWPADPLTATLGWFNRRGYRCGWGIRTWPPGAAGYKPDSYQMGSVWPVWTATTLLTALRYDTDPWPYRVWVTGSQLMFRPETNGHMPEALRGDRPELLREAVPHQMFSQLLPVNVFFNGFLGLCPDLIHGRVRLAPRLPDDWKEVEVRRLRLGRYGTADLAVRCAADTVTVIVDTTRTVEALEWVFSTGDRARWQVDGRSLPERETASVVLNPGRHIVRWQRGR